MQKRVHALTSTRKLILKKRRHADMCKYAYVVGADLLRNIHID